MTRFLAIALAIIAALLGGTVALELSTSAPEAVTPDHAATARPQAGATETADKTKAAAVADHTPDWVETSLARPLFAPERRPAEEVASATPTSGASADGPPRLAAVLVSPSERRAIFAPPGDAKPIIVGEGATVAGFSVQSIEAGQVTLLGPDGAPRTLLPTYDPNRVPPPPPPMPVAQQPAVPVPGAFPSRPGFPLPNVQAGQQPGFPQPGVPGGPLQRSNAAIQQPLRQPVSGAPPVVAPSAGAPPNAVPPGAAPPVQVAAPQPQAQQAAVPLAAQPQPLVSAPEPDTSGADTGDQTQ